MHIQNLVTNFMQNIGSCLTGEVPTANTMIRNIKVQTSVWENKTERNYQKLKETQKTVSTEKDGKAPTNAWFGEV